MNICSFKAQVIQTSFQNQGTTDSKENRNAFELITIRDDLEKVAQLFDELHSHGKLFPTPMNGKTWQEEKDEHYDMGSNSLSELLNSGNIESCEIRTLVEKLVFANNELKNKDGFWNHVGKRYATPSEFYFGGLDYSLDEMISTMKKVINGTAKEHQIDKVNEILDHIGTSACEPRAFLEQDLEYDSSGITNRLATGLSKQTNHISMS